MSHAMNLVLSEYSVNTDYLRRLKPIGHLSGAYLQVLLHTARFQSLSPGEKMTSQSLKNYIVFLVDGCVEKNKENIVQQIKGGSEEALFQDDENAEVTITQKSMVIMVDKTLYGIFLKENTFRERINLA